MNGTLISIFSLAWKRLVAFARNFQSGWTQPADVWSAGSAGSNILLYGNPRKDSLQPAICRLPTMLLLSSMYCLVFWQLKNESVFFPCPVDWLFYLYLKWQCSTASHAPCHSYRSEQDLVLRRMSTIFAQHLNICHVSKTKKKCSE